MESLDDVRKLMKATGNFSEEALSSLTEQDIADSLNNAQPLPAGIYPDGVSPFGTTWTGNNFRIVNGKWTWNDQPGSMCGRTRTWEYVPSAGASYRQAGNCSQGYPWYEIYVPA